MKELERKITNLGDYKNLAAELIGFAGQTKKFVFLGNLGAGKTTLVQHLCQELGVEDSVSSPTFSLINQYNGHYDGKNITINHLDLYRLKSVEEALDIGIEELLNSNQYLFIEWPEIIQDLLSDPLCVIKIDHSEEQHRMLTCKVFD